MFTSEDSGLGCLATSSNFAERRSSRAAWAGPKTFAARRWLLAFLVLDRELFAILMKFSRVKEARIDEYIVGRNRARRRRRCRIETRFFIG